MNGTDSAQGVHQLVLAHGRERAREMVAPRQRLLIDIAAEVLADETQRIGISYTGFCLTSLPHKKLPDDMTWEKKGHHVIERRLSSIRYLHEAAGFSGPANPGRAEAVRLAMRRLARSLGRQQRRAAPLGQRETGQILAALSTGTHTTAAARPRPGRGGRRDGRGPRSKTDIAGAGVTLYLGPRTDFWLRRWIERAGITEGATFRAVDKAGRRLRGRGRRQPPPQGARPGGRARSGRGRRSQRAARYLRRSGGRRRLPVAPCDKPKLGRMMSARVRLNAKGRQEHLPAFA